MDEIPTLADAITKGFKTEKALMAEVNKLTKAGRVIGTVGKDHRVNFKPMLKLWFVEPIEDAEPPKQPEKVLERTEEWPYAKAKQADGFGSKIEGGNANPPAKKQAKALRAKQGPKPGRESKKSKLVERAAKAQARLERVKAGGPAPKKERASAPALTLPALDPEVTGPFKLVVPDWPEKADPRQWALEYSKKLRKPVEVWGNVADAKLAASIDHATLRPPRRGSVKRSGLSSEFDTWAIEMASRPEGVLRSALKEKAGRKGNWKGILGALGEPLSMNVTSDRSGSEPRYRLIKR